MWLWMIFQIYTFVQNRQLMAARSQLLSVESNYVNCSKSLSLTVAS